MSNAVKKIKHNYICEILKNQKCNKDINLLYYYNMLCPEWDNVTYFSLAKKINSSKMDRWSINCDELINLNVLNEKDFYCSVNTFYAPGKQTGKYAKTLNAIIIDLDYYNVPYLKDLEPNKVYELLKKDIDFPEISFYTESGRGMCLFWLLEKTYSTEKSRKFYKKIVETMIEKFKDFGADPKCKDVARVVRVPGTINSKNGNKVKIVIPDEYYTDLEEYSLTPIKYELYDLAEFFWGIREVKTKAPKKPKKAPKRVCKVTKLKNIYSLYCSRRNDLERLVKLRKDKPMEGHREQLLFLYRLNLLFSGTEPKRALELTLSLNNKLYDPLDQKEVEKATQSAVDNAEIYFRLKDKYNDNISCSLNEYLGKGGVYIYTNATIIKELEITPLEMEHMETLKNKEIILKNKRAEYQKNKVEISKKRKEKYDSNKRKNEYKEKLKEQGKMSRDEKNAVLRQKIKSLLAEGFTQRAIALKLEISLSSTNKHIKSIKENEL